MGTGIVMTLFMFFLFADRIVAREIVLREKRSQDGRPAATATVAAANYGPRKIQNEPHHQLSAPEHDRKGPLQHVRHYWPG